MARLLDAAYDAEPDLAAFLRWRPWAVTALVAEIAAVVPATTELAVIDRDGSWSGGIGIPARAPHPGGVLSYAHFAAPDRIGAHLAPLRATLGADRRLTAGYQLFHPNLTDAADLAARATAAAPHSDGLIFYNLGLVPPARLGGMRDVVPDAKAG